MDTGLKVPAQPKASLIHRLVTWPFRGKGWRKWAGLLAATILLYNLYAAVALRRPPIHGVVVDADTQEPISGAEVWTAERFTILFPVETADRQVGNTSYCVTDSQGRFVLRGSSIVSDWMAHGRLLDLPIIALDLALIKWGNEIGTTVFAKDYVTLNATTPVSFFHDQSGRSQAWGTWSSRRVPICGYFLRVEIHRPRDEAGWRERCRATTNAVDHIPDEIGRRWYFVALTDYWIRYPRTYYEPYYALGFHDFGPFCSVSDQGKYVFDCKKFHSASLEAQADFLRRFNAIGEAHKGRIELLREDPKEFESVKALSNFPISSSGYRTLDQAVAEKVDWAVASYSHWQREWEEIQNCGPDR